MWIFSGVPVPEAEDADPPGAPLEDGIIGGQSLVFLEGPVRHWHEGTPGITRGTFMTTPPDLIDDLKWLGVNLVSCANNHAFDYGEGGVMATVRHLENANLSHAGSGANLAQARAPGYLDTAHGRIGLVSAAATFRPWNIALRTGNGGRI